MTSLILLTIIVQESLAGLLQEEISDLGAKGFTTTSVSGKGIHGLRDNQWEGENTKIETIVSHETCTKILDFLQQKYFDRYAMIAFSQPVSVVRANQFL